MYVKFCLKTLKKELKRLFKFTANFMFKIKENFQCITMNGDRNQKQREEALRSFRRGDTPVMVVTAVAERGLDIKVALIVKILYLSYSF